MAFTPTRISELSLITPLLNDQLVIARGSGGSGRTYRIFVRDLIGNSWNVINSSTVNLHLDSTTLTLSADVIDKSITNEKLRDSLRLSVIGRSSHTFGAPADIAASTSGHLLRVNDGGTSLNFGPLNLSNSNSTTGVLPISAGGTGSDNTSNLVPIGAIVPIAVSTLPIGWLFCDGSTIPATGTHGPSGRPAANLQQLRTLLGTQYGSFGQLPDLRGMFVRGWDAGRGVDPGRTFGSQQLDAFQGHKHGLYDPQHNHGITDPQHAHPITDPQHAHPITDPQHNHGITDPQHGHTGSTNETGNHNHTIGQNSMQSGNDNTRGGEVGGSAYSASTSTNGAHSHTVTVNNASTGIKVNNAPTGITVNNAFTGITVNNASTGITVNNNFTNVKVLSPTGDQSTPGSGDVNGPGGATPRVADETRPENIALYYCIKY